MKYFVAIALIATVASANILLPTLPSLSADQMAEVSAIIAAIQSPSTDPATAIALQEMLMEVYGFHPISVGPAIVDPVIVVEQPSPIHVGPEIVEMPEIEPSPVIIAPTPVIDPTPVSSSAPLVQIILNINQAQSEAVPPVVADVPAVEGPTPVIIVDEAPAPEISPMPIPAPIDPTPVIIAPSPVIDVEPVVVGTPIFQPEIVPEPVIIPEPVVVGTPVLPTPVINLPDILN